MLLNYDKTAPLAWSFNADHFEIRKLFHDNKIGGLTTVSHRYVNMFDSQGPELCRTTPNGSKMTYFGFFDFNRLIRLNLLLI